MFCNNLFQQKVPSKGNKEIWWLRFPRIFRHLYKTHNTHNLKNTALLMTSKWNFEVISTPVSSYHPWRSLPWVSSGTVKKIESLREWCTATGLLIKIVVTCLSRESCRQWSICDVTQRQYFLTAIKDYCQDSSDQPESCILSAQRQECLSKYAP